jgi:hypothetical protein
VSDYNPIERLAIEQAVYNAIGADLKTGVPDNLRGEVNGFYLDMYERTGATGFEVRVNGQKVGTYGFSKVKGKPERTVTELRVTDEDALRADKSDEFNDWLSDYINYHLVDFAIQYAQETGDLLDGMELVEVTTPAVPDGIRPNGTLRVKPEKVAAALGNALPATIAGLLEGGGA